jgi:hypothetical protein
MWVRLPSRAPLYLRETTLVKATTLPCTPRGLCVWEIAAQGVGSVGLMSLALQRMRTEGLSFEAISQSTGLSVGIVFRAVQDSTVARIQQIPDGRDR